MTITCGRCGQSADVDDWTRTELGGALPDGHFQCPNMACNFAFERRHGAPKVYPSGFIAPGPVTLVPVQARL